MERFCVFCGNKPESKNREHVIPQWLIKLTGDPNRNVYLGRKWTSPDFEERRFALNSYAFPACKDCNTECSHLEARAQLAVKSILARSALNAEQWDTVLDWLDKVRTGLWLAGIYLNEDYRGVNPSFHIRQRIGAKDRFLIIYEIIDDGKPGVNWCATDTPLFEYMPSCFSITINNFLFFDVSYDFLFAQRFGFPYPVSCQLETEGRQIMDMIEGTHTVRLPLLDGRFKTGGTQLYQPIIPHGPLFAGLDGQSDMWNHQYVRAKCMDFDKGKGRIFRRDRNRLAEYPAAASREWIPKQRFPREEVFHQTAVMAGQMLETLYSNYASLDELDAEEAARIGEERDYAVQVHRALFGRL